MLALVTAALLAAPALATTTVSLDSGWAYSGVGDDDCSTTEDADVSASVSFSSSSATVADIRGIHVDIAAMHGGCTVYVDSATLYLDGTAVWSQSIGATGSGLACCEWYVDLDYSPASLSDQILSAGSHTLQLDVDARVSAWGEQVAGRISATVEHGRDWDGDGYDSDVLGGSDCDDDDAGVNPGASEIWYDGVDADCDGGSDFDADGDGYDHSGHGGSDCDDSDASVSPAGTELCNGIDDDCDGSTDEASAVDASTWYADTDGDGFGDAGSTTSACSEPRGYSSDASDCDDGDGAVNPAATEICNGIDDDCDGVVDPDDAADAVTWYADDDGDGFGDAGAGSEACAQPSRTVADATDCDDGDGAVNPAATELCNGIDDDCDGVVDPGSAADASTWYTDSDGDGYGDASTGTAACTQPSGTAVDSGDCDDGDPAVNPSATELCNDIDDDCDGVVDPASAADASTWYADDDGDGFGDPSAATSACDAPSGTAAADGDCDDGDGDVYPGAPETWYDGVDQDCDGRSDYDQDEDGWDHSAYGGDDCDDLDPLINPGVEERWYDGIDDDCDGASDYDMDGDGHDHAEHGGDDCDDGDAAVYPGAPDEPYDGVITDCDDSDEYDADGDGHDAEAWGGDDCDDAHSGVNPEQVEIWYDGVDQDCDGNDDDRDGDGWPGPDEDCDDRDPTVNPGQDEIWYDGVDQDCDGNDQDQDGDGWALDEDCDDSDPDSYPGAPGLDEDCQPSDSAGPDDTDLIPADSSPGPVSYRGGGGCTGCGGGSSALGLGWLVVLGVVTRRRVR